MALLSSEELAVRKSDKIDLLQVISLVSAGALLTVGLALFLSGAENEADLVQPIIVVFGGTVVSLLATFPLQLLGLALQEAVNRGIRGGNSPVEMIRAMMKISDITRRDGLQSVAEVETNSRVLNLICNLVCDAAYEREIRSALDQQRSLETVYHKMLTDVFVLAGVYALLIGTLGSVIRYIANQSTVASGLSGYGPGELFLPFICGCSLALLISIMVGRLRVVHQRELVVLEVAYQGAIIVLEDNNVQRLRVRLAQLLPTGLR